MAPAKLRDAVYAQGHFFACDVGLAQIKPPFLHAVSGVVQLGWSLFDEQCVLLGGWASFALVFCKKKLDESNLYMAITRFPRGAREQTTPRMFRGNREVAL